MKPVLFVTNHVPPDRVPAYAALHEREGVELALFGGRSRHAAPGVPDPGVPHRRVTQREVHALAASGGYRAVVAGTVGRLALPGAWTGARRAAVPFVLWTALWEHPRTPAHALSFPLLRRLYVSADAVVTYGPHVTAYVRARGARNVHEAPQAVDNAFWAAAGQDGPPLTALFVGRDAPEKGLSVLRAAWSRLDWPDSGLAVAGHDQLMSPEQLRNFYARADVVVIPSIATGAFREPWALVANEAMNQSTPVIATDAVGAAAGGLVRHERNGLVVRAGDAGALAGALRRLHDDVPLRERLGAQAARDVHPYTFGAWAAGFSAALDSVSAGASGRDDC
jgi:glycosyltransferase involved in cell wall biosynthesis